MAVGTAGWKPSYDVIYKLIDMYRGRTGPEEQ